MEMTRKPNKSPIVMRGNKYLQLERLVNNFPEETAYFVDIFTGSFVVGNYMSYICRMVWANDLNNNIINIFKVLENPEKRNELIKMIENTPTSQTYFHEMKLIPNGADMVTRAFAYLYLSTNSLYGEFNTFKTAINFNKRMVLKKIKGFYIKDNVLISNMSYKGLIESFSVRGGTKGLILFYADPPYIEKFGMSYEAFTKENLQELIDLLKWKQEKLRSNGCNMQFCISEQSEPIVNEIFEKNKLNVITLSERRNLANRKIEILAKSY